MKSPVASHQSSAGGGRPSGAPTADLLATIVAATRRIVEVRQEREPIAALARRAEQVPVRRQRLEAALGRSGAVNVIAECKRRSPSRGVLRDEYDPVSIAKGYVEAGAAAISVLTEPTFFDGALDHLRAIRAAVEVPLLRKDFIVSEYQLLEAKAAGADAVLLIVAALEPHALLSLAAGAAGLGLDALVEVHDERELAVAIDAGARLVGVNNRNLRTLDVDVDASARLIARMPRGIVAVSESGLRTAGDLVRLRALGYHAFLIGERFMTEPDPAEALRGLLERCVNTKDAKDTKGKA
jgi:indole-3-glycerol phosphate synthase